MSSLNPGAGEGLLASFLRWSAIESVYSAPRVVCKRKWHAVYCRGCFEVDNRPYAGEGLTDCDIGRCLALHKQTIQHTQDGSRLALHLEYRGDSSLSLFS